jgi:hypothetical protein
MFSADEGADVGKDKETPVVEDYGIPAPYKFNRKMNGITIDVAKPESADRKKTVPIRKQRVKSSLRTLKKTQNTNLISGKDKVP